MQQLWTVHHTWLWQFFENFLVYEIIRPAVAPGLRLGVGGCLGWSLATGPLRFRDTNRAALTSFSLGSDYHCYQKVPYLFFQRYW